MGSSESPEGPLQLSSDCHNLQSRMTAKKGNNDIKARKSCFLSPNGVFSVVFADVFSKDSFMKPNGVFSVVIADVFSIDSFMQPMSSGDLVSPCNPTPLCSAQNSGISFPVSVQDMLIFDWPVMQAVQLLKVVSLSGQLSVSFTATKCSIVFMSLIRTSPLTSHIHVQCCVSALDKIEDRMEMIPNASKSHHFTVIIFQYLFCKVRFSFPVICSFSVVFFSSFYFFVLCPFC